MGNEVESKLTDELLMLLKKERFVTVITVDHVTYRPNVTAISWVYAPHHEKIRFSVDSRSRIIQNIGSHPTVTVNIIGNGSCYAVSGIAKVLVDHVKDISLKLSIVEIDIEEVRDVMFYGSRISVDPQYEKTYDRTAAAKLDKQVMDALMKG